MVSSTQRQAQEELCWRGPLCPRGFVIQKRRVRSAHRPENVRRDSDGGIFRVKPEDGAQSAPYAQLHACQCFPCSGGGREVVER
jgi:hypothetical protein